MIRKEGSHWIIVSKTTKRKLGTFKTLREAKKRLREIEYFKHKAK